MPGTRWLVPILVALATIPARAGDGDDSAVIVAGPLTLRVSIARMAHLFHVVDQLSGWSPFCHRQYRESFEKLPGGLDATDHDLLNRHAALRRVKGWGRSLEQAFYVDASPDVALQQAIAQGHLTAEEAATERAVFDRFADRVDRLMAEERSRLIAFRDRLHAERDDLAAFARRISRFVGGATLTVPVFLMANPSRTSIGGGYNGGRLTIEIPTDRDAYPSFCHEVFHAFLEPSRPALARFAATAPGLDVQTLNEGLAYALSPGLIHPKAGPSDPLRDQVARDAAARKPLADEYARFNRFGLALRPGLARAIDDPNQTIETYLPRAVEVWAVVQELSRAWDGTSPQGANQATTQAGMFSFGPGWQTLGERMAAQRVGLRSANHHPDDYQDALARAKPGDPLVLLFASDHQDRALPEAYRDLLPVPWAEFEGALRLGHPIEKAGEARGRRVILLLAPTLPELEGLIRRTTLLNPPAARAKPGGPG